jgi:hypothetical protein
MGFSYTSAGVTGGNKVVQLLYRAPLGPVIDLFP